MKRTITDIMKDMDELETVKISEELADTLKDYFKDEIQKEDDQRKSENEKVAKGAVDSFLANKGNAENVKSDRV